METDNLSFCRICFSCTPEMFELDPFLPVIRLIAQTKVTINSKAFCPISKDPYFFRFHVMTNDLAKFVVPVPIV